VVYVNALGKAAEVPSEFATVTSTAPAGSPGIVARISVAEADTTPAGHEPIITVTPGRKPWPVTVTSTGKAIPPEGMAAATDGLMAVTLIGGDGEAEFPACGAGAAPVESEPKDSVPANKADASRVAEKQKMDRAFAAMAGHSNGCGPSVGNSRWNPRRRNRRGFF
jgi:hypothetical protein